MVQVSGADSAKGSLPIHQIEEGVQKVTVLVDNFRLSCGKQNVAEKIEAAQKKPKGRREAKEAAEIKVFQIDRAGACLFLQKDRGYQKAAQYKENIDTEKPAFDQRVK